MWGNVGGSIQVPVRAWNNARKDTWVLPPPVNLERRDMTYTVSMWRKTQKNKNKQTRLDYKANKGLTEVTSSNFIAFEDEKREARYLMLMNRKILPGQTLTLMVPRT
jgi:hypothetical protein